MCKHLSQAFVLLSNISLRSNPYMAWPGSRSQEWKEGVVRSNDSTTDGSGQTYYLLNTSLRLRGRVPLLPTFLRRRPGGILASVSYHFCLVDSVSRFRWAVLLSATVEPAFRQRDGAKLISGNSRTSSFASRRTLVCLWWVVPPWPIRSCSG